MHRYLASILLILGSSTFSAAAAQTVPQQTTLPAEVLLLDPRGFALLGHGTMDGNVLRLEVLYEVGDFVLLLIGPTGALERFVGSQGFGGELRLEQVEDLDAQLLEQFFAARHIELVVVRRSRLDAGDGATDVTDVDGSDRPDDEAEVGDDRDDEDDDADDGRGDDEDDSDDEDDDDRDDDDNDSADDGADDDDNDEDDDD